MSGLLLCMKNTSRPKKQMAIKSKETRVKERAGTAASGGKVEGITVIICIFGTIRDGCYRFACRCLSPVRLGIHVSLLGRSLTALACQQNPWRRDVRCGRFHPDSSMLPDSKFPYSQIGRIPLPIFGIYRITQRFGHASNP